LPARRRNATQLLLDFSQPVALLLVAVLHVIPDEEDPWGIVARLRDALAPGSYLVVCQARSDAKPELASATMKAYEGRVAARSALRPRADIGRFFDGFDLVDPGLVWLPEWRPDSPGDVPEDPRKSWGSSASAAWAEPASYGTVILRRSTGWRGRRWRRGALAARRPGARPTRRGGSTGAHRAPG